MIFYLAKILGLVNFFFFNLDKIDFKPLLLPMTTLLLALLDIRVDELANLILFNIEVSIVVMLLKP